jgi:hypothetical protein
VGIMGLGGFLFGRGSSPFVEGFVVKVWGKISVTALCTHFLCSSPVHTQNVLSLDKSTRSYTHGGATL